MNVLIIGGAGFLGANVVRHCLEEPNCSVTVLDSLEPLVRGSTKNIESLFYQIRFVKGDMRDADLLLELVPANDFIINCAGQTSHVLSLKHPVLDADINCIGNLTLLEAIREHNPEATVLYTSSISALGPQEKSKWIPAREENPLDIYSANKGVAEKYYSIYHTRYNLNTIVLRFGNLYGPYGKGFPEFGFVNYFIDQARRDETIKIFGAGSQKRNLLYAKDAARAMWSAMHNPSLFGQVRSPVGPDYLSVYSIAQTIVATSGSGTISNVDWPEDRLRIEVGDVARPDSIAEVIPGWSPQYSFPEGLKETFAIIDKQPEIRPIGIVH